MIKIRLARHGKKNDPYYRIVATEHGSKRSGKALEILGFWHPSEGKKEIDQKKVNSWIKKGAKMTEAVKSLVEKK